MVGMRFLRLLVRCLPSRDIPQAAKFFAGACFPELHPIAKGYVAHRLGMKTQREARCGARILNILCFRASTNFKFFEISRKSLISQAFRGKKNLQAESSL